VGGFPHGLTYTNKIVFEVLLPTRAKATSDTQFRDRLRLPLDFDPRRLADKIRDFSPGQSMGYFAKQHYNRDWSVISLLGNADTSTRCI